MGDVWGTYGKHRRWPSGKRRLGPRCDVCTATGPAAVQTPPDRTPPRPPFKARGHPVPCRLQPRRARPGCEGQQRLPVSGETHRPRAQVALREGVRDACFRHRMLVASLEEPSATARLTNSFYRREEWGAAGVGDEATAGGPGPCCSLWAVCT